MYILSFKVGLYYVHQVNMHHFWVLPRGSLKLWMILTCQLRDNYRTHYIFTEGEKSRLVHLAVKIDFSNVKRVNCLIIISLSKA